MIYICQIYTATAYSVLYVRTHVHSVLHTKTLALVTKKGDCILVRCNSCCLGEWNFSLLFLNSTE